MLPMLLDLGFMTRETFDLLLKGYSIICELGVHGKMSQISLENAITFTDAAIYMIYTRSSSKSQRKEERVYFCKAKSPRRDIIIPIPRK
jgi:hypothetical protein